MTPLKLSDEADADLADILSYSIETFGRELAEDYLRSFERCFDLLRDHPGAGALLPDVDPPIHSLPHRSHRIYYDVAETGIVVQRVLHKAMDARRRLGR